MQIRNSDIVFGRIAATFKFADKEAIRLAIQEVGALQGFGIDKRIHQVLFEKHHLNPEQIYAILEVLLETQTVKRIRTLVTYLFTEEDEKKFYEYLGWQESWEEGQDYLEKVPEIWIDKMLPILKQELLLCVNIKRKLQLAGISLNILEIIRDKQLLNTGFLEIFPDLNERKRVVIDLQKYDATLKRKNAAVLFSQLAICNGYMKQEDVERSIFVWEGSWNLGIRLKYAEVLFYMGILDETNSSKIAVMLQNLTKIDQGPRFPLMRLNAQERHYLDNLHEKGLLDETMWQEGQDLLIRLQHDGLEKMHLGDLLILQKKLSRKSISKQWAEYRKKEVAMQVKDLQMDKTQETRISFLQIKHELDDELAQTEEVIRIADEEVKNYEKNAKHWIHQKKQKSDEEQDFESKLKEDLLASQEHIKAIGGDLIPKYHDIYKIAKVAGLILFLFFLVFLFLLFQKIVHKQEDLVVKQESDSIVQFIDIQEQLNIGLALAKEFQYEKAIDWYRSLDTTNVKQEDIQTIQNQIKKWQTQQKVWDAFHKEVGYRKSSIVFNFRSEKNCRYLRDSEEGIVLEVENGKEWKLPWHTLKTTEIYSLFLAFDLEREHLWELACFCADHGLHNEIRKVLAKYVMRYPANEKRAWNLLSKTLSHPKGTKYEIWEGVLYTSNEMHDKAVPILDKPTVVEHTKTPLISKNIFSFQDWHKYQNDILRKQKKEYEIDCKKQALIFQKERWTSKETAQEENELCTKMASGYIKIGREWQSRSQLGKWMRATLKNGETFTAFFSFINNGCKVTYLSGNNEFKQKNQFENLEEIPFPWDEYFKQEEKITSRLENEYLALWSEKHGVDLGAKIQWEKILNFAPNYAIARGSLGYYFWNNKWQTKQDVQINDGGVAWENVMIPQEDLFRIFSVQDENNILFQEEFSYNQWKSTQVSDSTIKQPLQGNQMDIFDSFDSVSNLWHLGKGGKITDGILQINATGDYHCCAYLTIPWEHTFTLKCKINFPEKDNNKNMLIFLFQDPNLQKDQGYIIRLNWLDFGASKRDMKHQLIAVGQENESLSTIFKPIIAAQNWCNLNIMVQNDFIRVSIQGSEIFKEKLPSNITKTGIIGLGSFRSLVQFDDVQCKGNIVEQLWQQREEKEAKKQEAEQKKEQEKKFLYPAIYHAMDQMTPTLLETWKQGRIAFLKKQFPTAREKLYYVAQQAPKFPCVWLDLGFCSLEQNLAEQAYQYFIKAIELEPEWDMAILGRGRASQLLKNYNAAIEDYAKCLLLNKQNMLCHYALIGYFLEKGERESALSRVREIKNVFQNFQEENKLLNQIFAIYSNKIEEPIHSTENYEFRGKVSTIACQALGSYLEDLFTHFRTIFPQHNPRKNTVVVFETSEEMYKYLALQHMQVFPYSSAIWWNVTNELVVALDQHRNFFYRDLYREAFRQSHHQLAFPLPMNIYIGAEMYFSSAIMEKDTIQWEKILPLYKENIQKLYPYFSWSQWLETEQYCPFESYLVVHFLIHQEQEKWNQLLQELPKGKKWSDAFRSIFPQENDKALTKACNAYWK